MVESFDTTGMSKTIDNVSCRLGDDIAEFLGTESTVYVASSGFSLSTFEHLADELEAVKEVRFVFTAPAFVPQVAGMVIRPSESLKQFDDRHYRLESLRAELVEVEKRIAKERQFDRKYELSKDKQKLQKEIEKCR